MAVIDDVNRLAAQDVVYLARLSGGVVEVFRGRLRQSLNGAWVFNASTGQNGVLGFVLGGVSSNWTSSEFPDSGLTIVINLILLSAPKLPTLTEQISLTSVIPGAFTE